MTPETFPILITTAFGLESVVQHELTALGLEGKGLSTGRVLVHGTLSDVCRLNLNLRSAERVTIGVGRFDAPDFDALFEITQDLPWERWIPREFAFPVDGRSHKSQLTSVPAIQRTVKKAIVNRLMKAHRTQSLPETGPIVRVEAALLDNVATLTIDTSGDGLHKRGYRTWYGAAALRETMAAALVQLSTWRDGRVLWDPFCGSGTIAIEAAMIGLNMAPGLQRRFESERWSVINGALWKQARQEAMDRIKPKLEEPIFGSDIDPEAVDLAIRAAKLAGVGYHLRFDTADFRTIPTRASHGVVITNPPYGVRIGEEAELEILYSQMPVVFSKLPSWSFHVLTGRLDLERIFGQEASRRRKLFNAEIECTYFTFLGPKPPRKDAASSAAPKAPEAETSRSAIPAEESTDITDDQADLSSGDDAPVNMPAEPEQHDEPAPPEVRHAPAFDTSGPAFAGLRERDLAEAAEFARCLGNNLRHLRKYPSRGINAYRVYERDYPEVPLIIDRYNGSAGDCYHAVEYEREHSRTALQQSQWYTHMQEVIARTAGVPMDNVFMKPKPRQRGLTQFTKLSDRQVLSTVVEDGLKFEVNLTDYIDTGLFLDHRLTRQMVCAEAAGKRFLNLFCYTGSFTVYAAAGGAKATASVDLSNNYLDWADRNLQLNGYMPGPHDLIRADALAFLADHPRPGRNDPDGFYDLVVVDPPTFSNSKSTQEDWQVAESHGELFTNLVPLLAHNAVVYFSTNYRRFKLDEDLMARLGLRWREITSRTLPPEYRNERIHRCWRMELTGQTSPPAAAPRAGS